LGQAVRKATRCAACGRDEGPPPTASAGGRAVCCPAYACLLSRCDRLCNLPPCRRARPLRRPCTAPLPGMRRVRQLQAGLPVDWPARPPSIQHRPRIAAVPRRWLATAQASPGAGAGGDAPPAGGIPDGGQRVKDSTSGMPSLTRCPHVWWDTDRGDEPPRLDDDPTPHRKEISP
jgi:hypothetical protein